MSTLVPAQDCPTSQNQEMIFSDRFYKGAKTKSPVADFKKRQLDDAKQ